MVRNKRKLIRLTVIVLIITLGAVLLRTTPFVERLPLPGFIKSVFVSQSEEEKAKEQTKTLIAQVKKHIVLPDEEPVVATITDSSLLVGEQKFFEGAQNGDMLLVFPKAAKAIVYSPTRDLIVNAGPLIAPPQTNVTEEQNPTPAPSGQPKSE